MADKHIKKPCEGIRSTGTNNIFKTINAEINSTQNRVLVGLGLVAAAGVFGYITYVRHKYERLGYYMALREDGRTEFIKKKSNWES